MSLYPPCISFVLSDTKIPEPTLDIAPEPITSVSEAFDYLRSRLTKDDLSSLYRKCLSGAPGSSSGLSLLRLLQEFSSSEVTNPLTLDDLLP